MFRFIVLALLGLATVVGAVPGDNHVILITIDGGAAFYFNDPKAPLTNVRQLAAQGVVAKGMHVSTPAITWPNHTTLVTGVTPAKHSVLYNGVIFRNESGSYSRNSQRPQKELVAVPTVFDFLHDRGYSTVGVNWPCTIGSTGLDITFPDVVNQLRYTTPELVRELTALKILDDSSEAAFNNHTGPERDTIWAKTADHLLRTQKPRLMLLHFLMTDSVQHRLGPQCPEAYEALRLIDQHIGNLVKTLNETGLRDSTSVIICADHGFARVQKQIVGNAVLHKAGLLETEAKRSRVQIITEGGTAIVYFNSDPTRDADIERVIKLFKRHEGIAKIIRASDYPQYGLPSPQKNPFMGELVLCAKDGYSFSSAETVDAAIVGTRPGGIGAHGYLATNPKMDALFIAFGNGIARGKKIGYVNNIDVAPTVAHLFGETMPNVDGHVLKEILAKE